MSTTTSIVWLSLDPVRHEINFYPRHIACKIENHYRQGRRYIGTSCYLGSDFFDASIHFHPDTGYYQTTPGINLGRSGYKVPGRRSVQRIELSPTTTHVEIHTRKRGNEWIITNHIDSLSQETLNIETLNIEIPLNVIINNAEEINEKTQFWLPEDLTHYDKFVVVWQWCRGVPERQGDLMTLGDEWWIPYLQHQNQIIETSYNAKEPRVDITLSTDNSKRQIKFNENNSFASQLDIINHKSRCVRRVVITIAKLKEKLENMNNLPLDPTILSTLVENNEIPNEYFCCISQEVMTDPVKTTDNHTYDRLSIERWFQTRHTSPLTGLVLDDITLTPCLELKNQIQEFIRLKMSQSHSNEETLTAN